MKLRSVSKSACIVVLFTLAFASTMRHAAAADPSKVLHVFITSGESTLDPAAASGTNTLSIIENIFDSLLRYDYLARPVKLQANTTTGMPVVSDGDTTYTFHIRPGIYFTPDPAFAGKRRELTAQDYVYSFKRIYDPALKSPWLFLFDGKLVGDEVYTQAPAQAVFAYDRPLAGLQATDRYTLRIRLKQADPQFLFKMAMPATGAVAREVIDAYAAQAGAHPVGTGPFLMQQWRRSSKMILTANPGFRQTIFHAESGLDLDDRPIAAALEGKRLPLIGGVEVTVVEEEQARVLGFLGREFDYIEQLPPSLADMVLSNGKLKRALARQGIRLALFSPLQTYYMWMNMEDPVIGGYGRQRIALRRAISLSYNRTEDIAISERGLALPAQSPLPPNVLGYDATYRSDAQYDIGLARALLDRFGYTDRDGDGYREAPDGKPLTLVMHTIASGAGRLRDELWRRSLDAIGIRINFKSDNYAEVVKAARLGKVQMFETNWIADYPDGDNFFQLLYGPNTGRTNYARFNLPAFNRLYEQSRALGDSPQRNRLYRQMAQAASAYTPWVLRIHPLSADLRYPWVKNYKRHPVENTAWRYLDIDVAQRQAAH